METRNTLRYLTGLLVLGSLAFIGCAQFQHQVPETLPFMDRSQTKTDGKVRVTVAVPSAEESEQIFGFPLAGKNIQPVWGNYRDVHKLINNFRKQPNKISVISERSNYAFLSY